MTGDAPSDAKCAVLASLVHLLALLPHGVLLPELPALFPLIVDGARLQAGPAQVACLALLDSLVDVATADATQSAAEYIASQSSALVDLYLQLCAHPVCCRRGRFYRIKSLTTGFFFFVRVC